MILKKIFCRHRSLSERKVRYENMRYNEYFGRVLGNEVEYRVCKICGEEIIEKKLARIVFLEDLEEELKEEFIKKRDSEIY